MAMVIYAWRAGFLHDHRAYLQQWELIRSGQDPWSTDNAYGPGHNLLAYGLSIGRYGPKAAIVAAFLVVNWLMVRRLLVQAPRWSAVALYALVIPGNFLVMVMAVAYGLNDALVAALVGGAVLSRYRGWLLLTGALLAGAVLIKYYPALLVPFFCLDRRRFSWRPLLAALAVAALGMAAAFAVWGTSVLKALDVGSERAPKLLSPLFAASQTATAPDLLDWLIRTNTISVVVATAVTFALCYALRLRWIEGAVIGLFTTLVTYKVGHQQFYLPWLFLLVGLLLTDSRRARLLVTCCIPFVTFLSVFTFGYEFLTDGYTLVGGSIRAHVGFLTLGMGVATIVGYLAVAVRVRPVPGRSRDAQRSVTDPERCTALEDADPTARLPDQVP